MWKFLVCGTLSALSILSVAGDHSEASSKHGLVTLHSQHSVDKTAERVLAIINNKSLTLFNDIDHAANAKKVGLTLRPTRVIIFGNPKVGTPLMACAQTVAIDLPQKFLITEDEQGKVSLSYNSPDYLAKRHKIDNCDGPLAKITGALSKISAKATGTD